ncbi:hypothetical protein TKK_0013981 [Trichogramma kaykai]
MKFFKCFIPLLGIFALSQLTEANGKDYCNIRKPCGPGYVCTSSGCIGVNDVQPYENAQPPPPLPNRSGNRNQGFIIFNFNTLTNEQNQPRAYKIMLK